MITVTDIVNVISGVGAFVDPSSLDVPKGQVTQGTIKSVLQVVFGVAGAIALLIITIGGFRYITSQGKPQEVAKAKDTIIYAIVGLIIAMTGFSIVRFVIQGVS